MIPALIETLAPPSHARPEPLPARLEGSASFGDVLGDLEANTQALSAVPAIDVPAGEARAGGVSGGPLEADAPQLLPDTGKRLPGAGADAPQPGSDTPLSLSDQPTTRPIPSGSPPALTSAQDPEQEEPAARLDPGQVDNSRPLTALNPHPREGQGQQSLPSDERAIPARMATDHAIGAQATTRPLAFPGDTEGLLAPPAQPGRSEARDEARSDGRDAADASAPGGDMAFTPNEAESAAKLAQPAQPAEQVSPALASPRPEGAQVARPAARPASGTRLEMAALLPALQSDPSAATPGSPRLAAEPDILPERSPAAILAAASPPPSPAPGIAPTTTSVASAEPPPPLPPSATLADTLADTPAPAPAPAPSPSSLAVPQGSAAPVTEARQDVRAPELRVMPQIEATIDQIGETRGALQASRPELTLRHHDFGAITMRIEALGNDLRATLSARDPGFVPAIQTALAERGVVASSEASSGQSHNPNQGQRGSDPNSANAASSGQGWQSEGRYGSSPGSGQGTYQPYRGQTDRRDEDTASPQGNAMTRGAAGASDKPGERNLFA